MKKLNLLLIPLLFLSLLTGCGMKGPLYRAPVIQPVETQQTNNNVKKEPTENIDASVTEQEKVEDDSASK